MRTSPPRLLPLFRSEMQVRLLGLLLLQPDRDWTLSALSRALTSPASSVHRELVRAVDAGLVQRDATARPHRYRGDAGSPLHKPLAELLRATVGVEDALIRALDRDDVIVALVHGSWARGDLRSDSDIDVLVIGDASPRELRGQLRSIGEAVGRTIDVTVLHPHEFRRLRADGSSFVRRLLESPITELVGDLRRLAEDGGGAG